MKTELACIRVKDLRLRTYIGIKDEEIRNRQDIIINVVMYYAAELACEHNQIEHALNYRTITKAIIKHVEEGRFLLLERLTHEVLMLVMTDEAVHSASVEIDKPLALRFSDSVSMTLSACR